nr:hypothetical protein [Mycoplasmopsis bovis]
MKNTKNIDLGNSLKNVFEWNDENKNVKHISDDQWKRLVNKYKRYNLGMNIDRWVEDRLKKVKVPAAKKDKIKWWNIRWIFKWSK